MVFCRENTSQVLIQKLTQISGARSIILVDLNAEVLGETTACTLDELWTKLVRIAFSVPQRQHHKKKDKSLSDLTCG